MKNTHASEVQTNSTERTASPSQATARKLGATLYQIARNQHTEGAISSENIDTLARTAEELIGKLGLLGVVSIDKEKLKQPAFDDTKTSPRNLHPNPEAKAVPVAPEIPHEDWKNIETVVQTWSSPAACREQAKQLGWEVGGEDDDAHPSLIATGHPEVFQTADEILAHLEQTVQAVTGRPLAVVSKVSSHKLEATPFVIDFGSNMLVPRSIVTRRLAKKKDPLPGLEILEHLANNPQAIKMMQEGKFPPVVLGGLTVNYTGKFYTGSIGWSSYTNMIQLTPLDYTTGRDEWTHCMPVYAK